MNSLLVVDDHPSNRMVIIKTLEDLELDIIEANSGEAALAALLKSDVFLILMDVNMPTLNGFETSSLIRGQKKFSSLPIIFITGRQVEDIAEQSGYATGAVDFLTKPINPLALISKVKVFLELHKKNKELELQHQKILHQQNTLKTANAKLNSFTHTVAHDLKNPLATMVSSIEFLLMDGLDSLNAKEVLTLHQKTGHRMLNMIDQLLESAEHLRKIHFFSVNLNQVVENVLSDLDLQIKNRKAKIESPTLPTVQGSELHLYQVFQNIIANSLKYSKSETPVHIEISSEIISKSFEEGLNIDFYRISIKDNGKGFDPTRNKELFQPFQRLTEHGEGRGIGLSTVQRIVEEHGGEITAESELGAGATFHIDLPVKFEVL